MARILGLGLAAPTIEKARAALADDPTALAAGLVAEAAGNDDVTSREAAIEYIDSRVAFFADLLDEETTQRVRAEALRLLTQW